MGFFEQALANKLAATGQVQPPAPIQLPQTTSAPQINPVTPQVQTQPQASQPVQPMQPAQQEVNPEEKEQQLLSTGLDVFRLLQQGITDPQQLIPQLKSIDEAYPLVSLDEVFGIVQAVKKSADYLGPSMTKDETGSSKLGNWLRDNKVLVRLGISALGASTKGSTAEYDIGGKLSRIWQGQDAQELEQQKIDVEQKKIEAAEREAQFKVQTTAQEKADALAQKKEQAEALIEQRKLDREARVAAQRETTEQRKADREQRRADFVERVNQAKQFHDENLQIRKDMLDLSKQKMTRIPPSKAKEIGDKIQGIKRYADLGLSFNDKYAGSVVGGPTMTSISEKLGKNEGRVNWWKSFKMMDVKLRNEMFGATLTNNEQKAWDSVTVSENSDPKFVKSALMTRAKIAQDALSRELESYSDAGYDVKKISGSAARPLPKF